MEVTGYDFSGYATKFGIRCADGRTISKDAFAHQDGLKVPFVWQHGHNNVENILGHAILEYRPDGMYSYVFLNGTSKARHAKEAVSHGDVNSFSIFANRLNQQGAVVKHGYIKEVSLCLAGANSEAVIDNIVKHSDDDYDEILEDEAVIKMSEPISVGEEESIDNEELEHADGEKTLQSIFNTLNEEQKECVYAMIGYALEEGGDMEHSDMEDDEELKVNVFEQNTSQNSTPTLSHDEIKAIFDDAKEYGSLKTAFLAHAQSYGIENIDILFPDAKNVTPTPDFIKRDTDWVAGVLNGTHHTPFSRIKSVAADITAEEARARGYIKGKLKKEEVIGLLKRVTTPTTIYKKQRLDRDDIIDATTLDVVAWLKAEMRLMLDEEIARAIIVGDGRDVDSDDKIREDCIRPIWKEDDLYAYHIAMPSSIDADSFIETVIRSRSQYKGSGNPVLYMTEQTLIDMLLIKDTNGRRIYRSESELAAEMRVSRIVTIPVMENQTRTTDDGKMELVAIMVNLKDYTVGADRGGNVSMFDDFDIDYNQYKYLIETRISGCLTHPKSAIVFEKKAAASSGTGGTGGTGGTTTQSF